MDTSADFSEPTAACGSIFECRVALFTSAIVRLKYDGKANMEC